ncbi:MAG: hypothetical protein ACP6IU_13765 [Candidatus Asgardarchaeia archaeon]
MTVTIRISLESKKKLDKLQAVLSRLLGRKLIKEEILEALIDTAETNIDELIRYFSRRKKFSIEDLEKIFELAEDLGVETSEEDIDDIVYRKM